MTTTTAALGDINMQLEINASPEAVWKSLTEQIAEWWPAEFYAGGEEGRRRVTMETEVGGRMYETWDGGGGALWATIVCVQPNELLQVHGQLFPNWGGPSEWFGTWKLEATPTGTLLTFNEGAIGRITDKGTEDKDKGWQFLAQALRAHAEGESPPVWAD